MRPIILGQAPARSGDGRPFSGPSGRRLCSLAGLANYEELRETFNLKNLVSTEQPKRSRGKGDHFPLEVARANAQQLKQDLPAGSLVICAGRQVARLMDVSPDARLCYIDVWRFGGQNGGIAVIPHPSGISHYWNDAERVRKVQDFLRWVIEHYGDTYNP